MSWLKLILPIVILTQLCASEVPQISRSNATLASSTLRPAVERVFSRKRRFLLLPKGSNVKFTVSLSKHLISSFPRGFQFNVEMALYYPTPTSRIDLLPKRLRKPTTTTPKPKGTTEPNLIYIPGSLLRYKAKPAIKPAKVQRIGEGSVQWIDKYSPQNYEKYSNPSKWTQWAKYGAPEYAQKYEWTPAKIPATHDHWQPPTHAKWTKWTTEAPRNWWSNGKRHDAWPQRERWGRDLHEPIVESDDDAEEDFELHPYQPMHFDDLEEFEDWRHYHSHRDRRQLFAQFEGLSRMLGIDMKSCILRTICESKRFLLSKGYSMIHDILRVVFNFPTINGLKDDYSRIMKSDSQTCEKRLHSKCPFSVLDLLLTPQKGL